VLTHFNYNPDCQSLADGAMQDKLDVREPGAHPFEEERAELEVVLASGIFHRSSNSAHFLTYVCQQYFEGLPDRINETDIAVSALGRKPDFDPRTDSVVRVEARRLRIRLSQFYSEHPERPLQIVLPAGQYGPTFVRQEAPPELAGEALESVTLNPAAAPSGKHTLRNFGFVAAGILLVILAVASILMRGGKPAPEARPADPPKAAIPGGGIRIRCGSSTPFVDQDGTQWGSDQYYRGGRTSANPLAKIIRASDPTLYTTSRRGSFEYDIPLQPGIYELRLHFAEVANSTHGDDIILNSTGENSRTFSIELNGQMLISGLDLVKDAGGVDTADIKVYRNISPASDGFLHLRFTAGDKGEALVNAIEITRGERGRLWPIRWVAQLRPVTGQDGTVWLSDRFFRGGRLSYFRERIASEQPEVYQGERFGNFDYQIPVAPGDYTVKLHFAENYWGRFGPRPEGGGRVFRVYSDSGVLLPAFDPFQVAGGAGKATVRTFRLTANAQQKLILAFLPIRDYATLNAIEVIDEGMR
jgi:hypothetical protein